MYNFDKDCEDDREMLREDPYAEYPDFPKECHKWIWYIVKPYKRREIMALEIKGLQRVFKFKKDSKELVLSDPNNELSVNEVMDFYSMTYPELTTATVHGPDFVRITAPRRSTASRQLSE